MVDGDIFNEIVKARANGETVVVATIINEEGSVPRHTGAKMMIYQDGRTYGSIGGGEFEFRAVEKSQEVFKTGKSLIITVKLNDPANGDAGVCGGEADIFLEIIMVDPVILIIGAGHCGRALSELAKWLGYTVFIVDDRADLCNEQILPHADQCFVMQADEIAEKVPIHHRTYIAAVTRNMEYDVKMLPDLINTEAAYIGVMGSKRRWSKTLAALIDHGVNKEALDKITNPIGLEIEAETPEEIAVSIMGQIITEIRTS